MKVSYCMEFPITNGCQLGLHFLTVSGRNIKVVSLGVTIVSCRTICAAVSFLAIGPLVDPMLIVDVI
jgi:hypothetical protein